MNIQQNTLGQILAAKSVAIQTEFRTYSADADESTAWLQLMAAGVRVAHVLTEHIPGLVADLTAVDSRIYWVQEHQGRASLCSGSITKDDDPRDDVRLLEDIEGLSATELQEIAHNLEKWLSRDGVQNPVQSPMV